LVTIPSFHGRPISSRRCASCARQILRGRRGALVTTGLAGEQKTYRALGSVARSHRQAEIEVADDRRRRGGGRSLEAEPKVVSRRPRRLKTLLLPVFSNELAGATDCGVRGRSSAQVRGLFDFIPLDDRCWY
jgi:hypothetical protein